MKGLPGLIMLAFFCCLLQCGSGVNYSRALFEHIPDDPELLVLVRPNDISNLVEHSLNDFNFGEFLESRLNIDAGRIDLYKQLTVEMLTALGIPWEQVESVGVMFYFKKPVILVTGLFRKADVTNRLKELGFKQQANGFFDYVYSEQKLHMPADGLMMMAEPELLEYLVDVPVEKRLWNRKDFAQYRRTSPLANSIFIWTVPPKDFLPKFQFRDEFGDLSAAIDFKRNLSIKTNIRLNSPEKTVYLHDIILGTVTVAQGIFGSDQDFGPLLKATKVSQDNQQVVVSLVVSPGQLDKLKKRIIHDMQDPDTNTFSKLRQFIDQFN